MLRRVLWFLVLLLPVLVSIGWLSAVDWERKVSTNVMDLLPDQSSGPELLLARSLLRTVYPDRVAVLLSDVAEEASVGAYMTHLRASPLVADVVDLAADDAVRDAGRVLFEHRFGLLFPRWLATAREASAQGGGAGARGREWLAEYAAVRLDAALERPDVYAFEELIPADPLLLVPEAAQAFQRIGGGVDLPRGTYLLEVKLAVSAWSKAGQAPVFELFEWALAAARAKSPAMSAIDSGAHRYAAMTEEKMKREVSRLNLSTFLVVLLICVLLCRRAVLVLHVFAMLSISLVISLTLMTVFIERINVFALVFGCVLCGVIVDYGLHAYLHGVGSGPRRLKGFLRPFLISSGSTLVGFAILLFSELPVLQQMGAFVSCGLGVATVVTLVYTFGVLRADVVVPALALRTRGRFPTLWLLPAVGLLSLFLLPQITWEDDIRSLKYPLPRLESEEARIVALRGEAREIIITIGSSYAEVVEHVSVLNEWLDASDVPDGAYLNAGQLLPTLDAYLAAGDFARSNPGFGEQVVRRLDARGYDGPAFAAFVEAWDAFARQDAFEAAGYERLVGGFSESLTGTLAGVLGAGDGLHWCVSLVDENYLPEGLPAGAHSMRLSQVESLSAVLSSYRHRTLILSLWAGAAIYMILLLVFRARVGSIIMSVPLAAGCAAAAALFYTVGNLGMFHLVGMFLGVCLVLDYAVFTWIGCRLEGRMPFSVVVSALTTSASFFILSLSRIPSIHALGLAVCAVTLIGVLLNYTFIPGMAERRSCDG